MKSKIFNKKLMIIAGPCSVDERNIDDIYAISQIMVNNSGKKQKAIFGTRVVGLKSRTSYQKEGKNMGIDFSTYLKNMEIFMKGGSVDDFEIYPSVILGQKIIKETGLLVATEVMDPLFQLPVFEKYLPSKKVLVWNPAVNQLGWPVLKMAYFAKKNHWYLGLKNPKWFGDEELGQTTMEKTWLGLIHYSQMKEPGFDDKIILIHRGVDVYNKGDYRNLPVHQAAKRVKQSTGLKLFFDPSHIHGPKLRDAIVKATVEAMKIMIDEENYLYDGILIEVGRSKTDTEQHITVGELKILCEQLSEFRILIGPSE